MICNHWYQNHIQKLETYFLSEQSHYEAHTSSNNMIDPLRPAGVKLIKVRVRKKA